MEKRKLARGVKKQDRFSQMTKWYEKGLNFKCQSCGYCCSISGFVWLSKKDILRICDFLKLEEKDFLRKYTRQCMGRLSLKEYVDSGACIFLKDNKCLIYPARPIQCSTYPFWPHILSSKKNFFAQKRTCKGIDSPACHFSKEEIEEKLKEHLENFSEKKL